jgi:hypothetical protein
LTASALWAMPFFSFEQIYCSGSQSSAQLPGRLNDCKRRARRANAARFMAKQVLRSKRV